MRFGKTQTMRSQQRKKPVMAGQVKEGVALSVVFVIIFVDSYSLTFSLSCTQAE